MEQVKKMLIDHEMNVNEVSSSIGYKNPRHFSAAFKSSASLPASLKKVCKTDYNGNPRVTQGILGAISIITRDYSLFKIYLQLFTHTPDNQTYI